MTRLPILLLALLALVISACASSEASASPTDEPSATPPAATETAAAEPSEDTGTGESAGAIPSFDLNGDPELAGRFPDTVGGEPLQVQSMGGAAFMAGGETDASLQEFLDSVGAEPSDVSVAFGGSASGLSVGAFRILGANEDDLEREFLAASEEAGDVSDLEQTSIAGKDVWTASDPSGGTDMSITIYTKDDTVYFLTGNTDQVTEILAALP